MSKLKEFMQKKTPKLMGDPSPTITPKPVADECQIFRKLDMNNGSPPPGSSCNDVNLAVNGSTTSGSLCESPPGSGNFAFYFDTWTDPPADGTPISIIDPNDASGTFEGQFVGGYFCGKWNEDGDDPGYHDPTPPPPPPPPSPNPDPSWGPGSGGSWDDKKDKTTTVNDDAD